MIQKPEKPQAPASVPASGNEIAWTIAFLAFCVMANSWLTSSNPELPPPVQANPAPAQVESAPASSGPQRPGRERPGRDSERPWRDPASSSLPSF